MVCLQEKSSSVRGADRSLKIAKELSDLVIYCQPVSFEWDNGTLPFLLVFFALFVCFILLVLLADAAICRIYISWFVVLYDFLFVLYLPVTVDGVIYYRLKLAKISSSLHICNKAM